MRSESASVTRPLAIAAAILLCVRKAAANADAGLNAAAFASLCGIYTLKEAVKPVELAENFESEDEIISSIFNANLSTATRSWLETKDGTLPGTEGSDERAQAVKEWQADVRKRQAAKAGTNDGDTYAPVPETPYKALANIDINSKHKQAANYAADFRKERETMKLAFQTAKDAINQAIYGENTTSYTGKGMSSTKQHSCGDGTNGHASAGYSVINDMICLCTPHSSGSGKPCGQKAFTDVAANPTSAKVRAGNELADACRKAPETTRLTPSLIQARVATVDSLIGAQPATATDGSAHYVLGLASNTGCTGSSQAECVNYVHQLKTPGQGITWVKHLEKAAQALAVADHAYTKAVILQEQLKALKAAAENTRKAAQKGIQLPSIATTITAKPATEETKEEDCNNKAENECTSPCKLVDTESGKKKCKLSDESKKSSEPTGPTGGPATADAKTNTTRSNSFVIKTSPLLIAFLLF
uniref:Variant surface glycoprotein 1125.82 n=1 Tax=Trypanosoma brucei TaxID=5691 RepID=A0A1J0R459_9TRYP|nr:variant surface glycoprotein 1125.82 [Trypanosoma brucei]